MLNVLVTGGAGYIGSHTLRVLKRAGYEVVVYDNFSRGHREAVKNYRVIEGDTADSNAVLETLMRYEIGAVLHFAAHSQVGESVQDPVLYYKNNVAGGLALLEAVLAAGVRYLVFSSSAAVYGEPDTVPIKETAALQPNNPYGETKLVLERALNHYAGAYGLDSISLRYFNAAGAAPEGGIGEDHDPETHLVPLVIDAALDRGEGLVVNGNDYPTPDGTPLRDYIHVDDLAAAHVLALEGMLGGKCSGANAFNLGCGKGYSVLEVIRAVEKVSGCKVPYRVGSRRVGDPAVLVASSAKAEAELGWKRAYNSIEDIASSAMAWHRDNPRGYGQ